MTMLKPVLSAVVLGAMSILASLASAKQITVDTSEKTGTLTVSIELRGKEAEQPYSLDLNGKPAKNSKGQFISASHIDAVDYHRRIALKIPLSGYLGGASGFHEIDSKEGDRIMAGNREAAAGIDPDALPRFDRNVLEDMQAAVEKCGENQACIADAARNFAAAMQGQNTAVPTPPQNMPAMPNLQRYLGLSAVRDPATGKCGTATFSVNDHHVGRTMNPGGWIEFDYHRQGRQLIPANDMAAGAGDPSQGFVDTSNSQATLCGSKVALDFDEGLYHLQLSGVSPAVRAINTLAPELPAIPISVMGDAEPKLLFLNIAGGGNAVSIAPFEMKNFYSVTGTQGTMVPLDATISWTITINDTLPK